MEKEQVIIHQIKAQGFLPLFYQDDSEVCLEITKTLYHAGIRSIEFTNRGASALSIFKQLVTLRNEALPGLLLGIGTIKTGEQATDFIEAGADFLISPVFDSSVCDVAYMHKILWIPGCMTPTEIHVAEKAGCTIVKLFPGNVLAPSFVEAIKPLFQNTHFLVTGGVDTTEENIAAWFKVGVAGVGMGSKLITKEVLKNKDYKGLQAKTEEIIAIVQKLKHAK